VEVSHELMSEVPALVECSLVGADQRMNHLAQSDGHYFGKNLVKKVT
jgi:ribosomal protein L32